MFHIKLTARPDARMVEVPLDIEVELPREFDGAAVLVSSGMPRKVRLRAPRDSIKLSTAYRIDQLVADLVRLVLRGQPQDVSRALEAAAAFLKVSRERRQEGSTFLVESDGRGRIDVVEQAATAPSAFRTSAGAYGSNPVNAHASSAGLNDRLAAIERSLAALEAKLSSSQEPGEKLIRLVGEQLERRIDQRLADIEEHLAAMNRGEQPGRPLTRTSAALPTPGASRGGIRRSTAVEAFAEGLRSELKLRAKSLLREALERAAFAEKVAQIATEAERSGGPKLAASETLHRFAGEATARTTALSRIAEEIEFYSAGDVPIASQLLDRLSRSEAQDVLPLLRNIVEEGWRAGSLQLSWLSRAAQIEGWKVIAPAPGDLFEPSMHEIEGPRGDVIDELLTPGVHDRSGAMLLHARVRIRSREEELPVIDPDLDGALPLIESSIPPPPPDAPEAFSQLERPPPESSPPSDDEIVSAQILDEVTSAPILSGPIISGPILSAPIVSGPITSGPILAGVILEEPAFPPLPTEEPAEPPAAASAQEIVSAPIAEEIVSAPIVEEIVSAPILDDASISAPILEDITAVPTVDAPTIPPPEPLEASPSTPPPPPVDEEWEKLGRGPSAFVTGEGQESQSRPAHAAENSATPAEPRRE